MGAPRLFLPQEKLDAWSVESLIEIEERRLALPGGGPGLDLEPAVRFIKEVGGEGDPHGLVGRVKTTAQLEEMGADHYRDSVLVGESAYEVVEGFVARPTEPLGARAPAGAEAVEPEAEGAQREAEAEPSDADELARLLIEKLD